MNGGMNGAMYNMTRPQGSSATSTDPLSPSSYGHGQQQYVGLYGQGGGGSGTLSSHHHSAGSPGGLLGTSNTASTQPPTPSSATASHMDQYSRPGPSPSYYSTAPGPPPHGHSYSYPQSSTLPSPSTSSGSPGSLLGASNTASAQPRTPLSANPSQMDPYSRSGPTPTYSYATATGPSPHQSSFSYQPSPTMPSPTTSAGGSRALHALSGLNSNMAPPQGFRPPPYHPFHMQIPSMQGSTVMTNLNNRNGQMTMMPGMNMPSYGHPMHPMYNHGAAAQAERPFKCDQCPQSFNRNHDLKRHKRIHLSVKPFPCGSCDKAFSRKDALKVCRVDECHTDSRR